MAPVGHSNTERDIGALQAAVQALADAVKTQANYHERMMEAQAESYNKALSELKDTINAANDKIGELTKELAAVSGDIRQAKGSWKLLVGLATVSAVIGGAFVKVVAAIYPLIK